MRTHPLISEEGAPETHIQGSAKPRFRLGGNAHFLSDLAEAGKFNIARGPERMMGFWRRRILRPQPEGKVRGRETSKWGKYLPSYQLRVQGEINHPLPAWAQRKWVWAASCGLNSSQINTPLLRNWVNYGRAHWKSSARRQIRPLGSFWRIPRVESAFACRRVALNMRMNYGTKRWAELETGWLDGPFPFW